VNVGTAAREVATAARVRVDDTVARVRRTTPGPLLVRIGLFVTALSGLILAWPLQVTLGPALLAFLLLAALTALFPRGPVPSLYLFVALVGWAVATLVLASNPDLLGLVLLASALYLTHNLAALAAVLPYDAVVAPRVLVRWLARAGLVLALTTVLALFAVVAPVYLGQHSYLVASLVGLALVAVTVAYLARLVRRR
jgi:hypothetical protein